MCAPLNNRPRFAQLAGKGGAANVQESLNRRQGAVVRKHRKTVPQPRPTLDGSETASDPTLDGNEGGSGKPGAIHVPRVAIRSRRSKSS